MLSRSLTVPTNRRRSRSNDTRLYASSRTIPASHISVRINTGSLKDVAGTASGAVSAGAALTAPPVSAGSGVWGSCVTAGAVPRILSAGTYSTALVRCVRSCAGAPSAPIRDTAEVTDTGHSSRNSTTAHRA